MDGEGERGGRLPGCRQPLGEYRQIPTPIDIPALDRAIEERAQRLGSVFLREGNVQVLPGHRNQGLRSDAIVDQGGRGHSAHRL